VRYTCFFDNVPSNILCVLVIVCFDSAAFPSNIWGSRMICSRNKKVALSNCLNNVAFYAPIRPSVVQGKAVSTEPMQVTQERSTLPNSILYGERPLRRWLLGGSSFLSGGWCLSWRQRAALSVGGRWLWFCWWPPSLQMWVFLNGSLWLCHTLKTSRHKTAHE
jgi:hypothetical protein